MNNHPIPRQITTFQFKLIGSLTVKQFAYLLATAAISISVYFLIPVPLLNILLAGLMGASGAAFSLLTYNDRSLDIWVKNLGTALISPSQYLYHKNNTVPDFLINFPPAPTNQRETHIDANNKLTNYLSTSEVPIDEGKQEINNLIIEQQKTIESGPKTPNQPSILEKNNQPSAKTGPQSNKAAFLAGVVQDVKTHPLEGIMIYVKNSAGVTSRILKSNRHGVFASFHPLADGEYLIEPKDLSGKHFFATINLSIHGPLQEPVYVIGQTS